VRWVLFCILFYSPCGVCLLVCMSLYWYVFVYVCFCVLCCIYACVYFLVFFGGGYRWFGYALWGVLCWFVVVLVCTRLCVVVCVGRLFPYLMRSILFRRHISCCLSSCSRSCRFSSLLLCIVVCVCSACSRINPPPTRPRHLLGNPTYKTIFSGPAGQSPARPYGLVGEVACFHRPTGVGWPTGVGMVNGC